MWFLGYKNDISTNELWLMGALLVINPLLI